jgi:hypothetical protein
MYNNYNNFPDKSIITAYRRSRNLKDILAPSKFEKQHVLAEIRGQVVSSVSENVICVIIS